MSGLRAMTAMLCTIGAVACATAPAAVAQDAATGGAAAGQPDPSTAPPPTNPTVPGAVARIVDGYASAPADAPPQVQMLIWAANQIVGKPYRYGGGHTRTFLDDGYDCSGTVSFALAGGGLLRAPRDSSSFARYGQSGPGTWVTIFTNPSHAYMTVAGIRLDTSAADDPTGAKGPRWRPLRSSDRGYKRRHPVGL